MSENCFAEFSADETCFVSNKLVDELIQKALDHQKKKYRYCLHQKAEDTLHEMVIVTTREDMKYPDKHMETTESNIILRGKLLVVLFGESGAMQEAFILDPEDMFYYRCKKDQYHMTIPLTDVAVYIEIKEGPFDEKSNTFPAWAPDRNNEDEVRAFNKEVAEKAMVLVRKTSRSRNDSAESGNSK